MKAPAPARVLQPVSTRLPWLLTVSLLGAGCTDRALEEEARGVPADPGPGPPEDTPDPEDPLRNAVLEPTTALQQSGLAGSIVAATPGVRVLVDGHPAAGVTVGFESQDDYGGAVSVTRAQTDTEGVATAQTWELGPYHATYVVVASLPGTDVEPVEFRAATTSAFELVLHGAEAFDPQSREQLDRAVRRWQGAVVNALPSISGTLDTFATRCERQAPGTEVEHRGVHVFVEAEPLLDAAGRGGPCVLRADGSPAFGRVTLDAGIVAEYTHEGALESLMVHELGHVLGVGTLWPDAGLLRDPASPANPNADPYFAGAQARAEFEAVRADSGYEGVAIPVEDSATLEGSVNSHWRESVIGSETMSTSRVSLALAPPLSSMTIASLADLGFYTVNLLAADPWRLPVASLQEGNTTSSSFGCEPFAIP